MPYAYREFPAGGGVAALFWEASGGGDVLDLNAPRNRPAKYPEQWLDSILFHSRLDHMEVAAAGSTTINHAAVAAATAGSLADGYGAEGEFAWRRGVATHVLATHSLGVLPFAIVAASDLGLCGSPVQTATGGRSRYVTPSVTTTQLKLHEWSTAGSTALPAISITYTWLVLKRPPAPSGNKLREFDPATGVLALGRNTFRTDRRYLQIRDDGTPLAIFKGRSIDLKNGAARIYRADGTYYEPVPAAMRRALVHVTGAPAWGASMAYNGVYAGPATIEVVAP